MSKLTQIFPFLTSIRTYQKHVCYIAKLKLDGNSYATKKGKILPYEVCQFKTNMINENSGYDIIYQKNKVHNLKVISKTMNQIYINPGQTFSFCMVSRKSRRYGRYKKGLVSVGTKIVAQKGGGVCHISNLLYYLFLMTPLTIVERHGHKVKTLPNPDKDSLEGVDATIYSSGGLDLKVKNNTNAIYQIVIDFDDTYMYGKIMSNIESKEVYEIYNEDFHYVKKDGDIYESTAVMRAIKNKQTKELIKKEKLYDEVVKVAYELPSTTEIKEN